MIDVIGSLDIDTETQKQLTLTWGIQTAQETNY